MPDRMKLGEELSKGAKELRFRAEWIGPEYPYTADVMRWVADNCDEAAALLFAEYQASDVPCPDYKDYPF